MFQCCGNVKIELPQNLPDSNIRTTFETNTAATPEQCYPTIHTTFEMNTATTPRQCYLNIRATSEINTSPTLEQCYPNIRTTFEKNTATTSEQANKTFVLHLNRTLPQRKDNAIATLYSI